VNFSTLPEFLFKFNEKRMNKNQFNLLTLLLMIGHVFYSSQLYANELIGALGTLKGAGATDIYQVTCFTDTQAPSQLPSHQLYFTIRSDTSAGLALSAQAIRNLPAPSNAPIGRNTTDNTGGDLIPSPDTFLSNPTYNGNPNYYDAANVIYTLSVDHSANFSNPYMLTTYCQDAFGIAVGTVINNVQNQ
jgi:hypothetical protein